jgi:hypothetical protein
MGGSFSGFSPEGRISARGAAERGSGGEDEEAERISGGAPEKEPHAPVLRNAKASPVQQWPCSNCHATVAGGRQARCSNCGGVQVRVAEPSGQKAEAGGRGSLVPSVLLLPSPYIVRYLERVVSPTPTSASGVDDPDGKTGLEGTEAANSLDRTYYSEDEDDDGDDDEETLEASPRPTDFAMMICDGDELRPVDPVAATLASVPSPVPTKLKFRPAPAPAYRLTRASAGSGIAPSKEKAPASKRRSSSSAGGASLPPPRALKKGGGTSLETAAPIPSLPPKKKLRKA